MPYGVAPFGNRNNRGAPGVYGPMTAISDAPTVPDIPGGPYDLEFFFDPGCPFAWVTSVWARRVAELRGISIGWRFVSLKFINEHKDFPEGMKRAQARGLQYHRLCAAARAELGNDAVGDLYRAYGERYWYGEFEGDVGARLHAAAAASEPAHIVADLGLPTDLLAHLDDDSWDPLIRAESDEAFRRTGPDVGTPIMSFAPPTGNSFFGPVISSVPDDETSLKLFDAMEVLGSIPAFSEIKRSARSAIDLPIFHVG
jgi:2-hydroxychromene-2-carboxylate isomerase